MKTLPGHVSAYSRSPTFDESTVPAGLRKDHQTKPGVWGMITILSGSLRYRIQATGEAIVLTPETPGIVEPEALHNVEPIGPVSFFVEFYR